MTVEYADAVMVLQGRGVAKGIAIGQAVVMGATLLEVNHSLISAEEVEHEWQRLDEAIDIVCQELKSIKDNLPADVPKEIAPLLTVHRLLASDPMLSADTKNIIQNRKYNAEWAISTQGQILAEQFSLMEDEYLRERVADINQVIERIIGVLSGSDGFKLPSLEGHGQELPLIVVAHDITPSDMLNLREAHFAAFLTNEGGPTSHTAIVARSMDVPAVVAMKNVRDLVYDRDLLVVDGEEGIVIVNPSPIVLEQYRKKQRQFATEREFLLLHKDAPAITRDGIDIALEGNIELPEEVQQALAMGAVGIGLYRSEFLFMGRAHLPSEQEQYEAYSYVLNAMGDKPVTIRTLDVGSDKTLDEDTTVSVNPALGLRAIRYCLANPDMFLVQLRALLRSSCHGKLRILVPMISHLHELHSVKRLLAQAQNELMQEGQDFCPKIELGAMVEIPAIAIAIEPFLKELDFVSIGTNDLIQYTLAIDRVDNEVSHLYDPVHPAVLRLIANTIQAGERATKGVAVCGEMAGEVNFTKLLLGLGLKEFSMHPQQIPYVKEIVRASHTNDLRSKVAKTLNHGSDLDLNWLNE